MLTALQDFMLYLLPKNQQEVVVVNDEAKLGPSSNICFSSVTPIRSSSCNTHEDKAARKWSSQKVNPRCTVDESNHSAPSVPTRGLLARFNKLDEENHSAPHSSLPTRRLNLIVDLEKGVTPSRIIWSHQKKLCSRTQQSHHQKSSQHPKAHHKLLLLQWRRTKTSEANPWSN
jgi:hypothetical protein